MCRKNVVCLPIREEKKKSNHKIWVGVSFINSFKECFFLQGFGYNMTTGISCHISWKRFRILKNKETTPAHLHRIMCKLFHTKTTWILSAIFIKFKCVCSFWHTGFYLSKKLMTKSDWLLFAERFSLDFDFSIEHRIQHIPLTHSLR